MTRISQQLLADKKKNVILDSGASKDGIQQHQLAGKDLLSVLGKWIEFKLPYRPNVDMSNPWSLIVKANMATDLKSSQKLSDEEVLGRESSFFTRSQYKYVNTVTPEITTFLVAGNETTR